jgi:plastocyanin
MNAGSHRFMKLRRHGLLIVLAGSALAVTAGIAVTAWAALTPIRSNSRDALFEIPKGTWARRMAGDKVEILPSEIHLVLGVKDILLLRNRDDVPQVFGPVLMMPGQSFRLPFEVASSYQFACTAHASGQMTITVDPLPASPWARIRWRLGELTRPAWWR